MLKRNLPPAHPGEILKEMFIKERNLTISEVAKGLNVARANLSAVINGHLGISSELAIKLSEAFGNTAQFWVNLQNNYDMACRKESKSCTDTSFRCYWRISGVKAISNILIVPFGGDTNWEKSVQ